MKAWKIILAVMVIFGAGVVVGGLVVKKISPSAPVAGRSMNGNPGQGHLQALLHRMDRELELSSDQHAQIEKIIAASQEHTREMWKPVSQEMSKETTSACDQIRQVLTPDQQVKFDALSKTRGDRGDHGDHPRRRGPWDGGPGGQTNFVGDTN